MRILVYGAGVIGSYLTHILMKGCNQVTLLARGEWAENLKENGLVIRHHLQHITTTDYPTIVTKLDPDEKYDVIFAVMPCHKMRLILDELASANTHMVVLVGNNLHAREMERQIVFTSANKKMVLFGFQATAGNKKWTVENGKRVGILVCERAGASGMDIGLLDVAIPSKFRRKMERIFSRTGYDLHWQDAMEDYLVCHVAAVMPLAYAAYIAGGDFSKTTKETRKLALEASLEAYNLLRRLGYRILPEGDDTYYKGGVKSAIMKSLYYLMAKTDMGDLIAAAHCRHAVEEMKMLDLDFEALRQRLPEYPMPAWEKLRGRMPSWDVLAEARERALAAGEDEMKVFAEYVTTARED